MTDEEIVDEIIDKACTQRDWSENRNHETLRAAILKALKDARQPTAYEVPGFTVIDLGVQGGA